MFGLSALAAKAIGAAVIVLVIFGTGFGAGMHWKEAEIADLKAEYATEKAAAIEAARNEQNKLDNQATAAAQQEAQKQRDLASQARTALSQVTKHVTNRPNSCIPWGAIRVFDGAILGRSADDLPYRAGIDDATCSPFTATQLAGAVVANYNAARANAAQLNALITLLRQYQGERK